MGQQGGRVGETIRHSIRNVRAFKFLARPKKVQHRNWRESVHQNLQQPKIDGYVFWDQNLCIVFDAHSPISLTGIDKIKHLYIIDIHIHIILLIFIIH
jgi:hypothetical protein